MNWYSKYLPVFEKPYEEVETSIIANIRSKVEKLQSEKPLVSIVIIAHNEDKRLLSCIWSLADNEHDYPIEFIGIDNCSTDKTTEIFKKTGVRHFYENKPGPGFARQCGLDNARGKYYLCIDGDSIYPPHYIQTMVSELMKPPTVAVFSLWSFIPNEKNTSLKLTMYEFIRDVHLRIQARTRPELSVRGMAFAFDTSLARKIGFRSDIRRGEDGSLALELKQHGNVRLITDRKARIVTSSGTLNADGSLFNSLKKRLAKYTSAFSNYFTKETKYKDDDSNML